MTERHEPISRVHFEDRTTTEADQTASAEQPDGFGPTCDKEAGEIGRLSRMQSLLTELATDFINLPLESERQFRALFVNSPISLIIHDRDTGRIIDANRTTPKPTPSPRRQPDPPPRHQKGKSS